MTPNSFDLENWNFDPANKHLSVTVSSTQAIAQCPVCRSWNRRIHSRYQRTLQDLALAQYGMTLQLHVRKFFCTNSICQRRIFTERLPAVTVAWARRTNRLAQALSAVALALGGAAGVRLSHQLNHHVSRNTLLKLISRLRPSTIAAPQVVGVDDFAFRKGQRYGTILVDLDRHRPIALLKDREANTLADWLKQHPSVQVLSRDREIAYKQGMSEGAPNAVQVADRFHLLQNLAEILERFFATHYSALKAVEVAHQRKLSQGGIALPTQPSVRQQQAEQRRARRLERYEQVHTLRQKDLTIPDIAHHLGMGERTVFRYLASPQFPEWQPHPRHTRKSALDSYKPYLVEQWNAGQRQTKRLFAQLQQQGYAGSFQTVARYTHRLRQAQRQHLNAADGRGPAPPIKDIRQPPLTARRATWLIFQRPEQLKDDDEALVTQLKAQHQEIETAITLCRAFAQLVRQRLPEQLDLWVEQAANSTLVQFQRFARSLQQDYEAVKAGVTLTTSNGQVEGQINRLKMLKRQMYGRAGFDLLRRRVLLAD
nr:ISL3 family transposase [Chroococcidiopsis sp. SAG 2025]